MNKNFLKNNKGITLIVLIITVIILIILTGITIDVVVDRKVFRMAQETVDESNRRFQEMQDESNEIREIIKKKLDKGSSDDSCSHNWLRGTGTNIDVLTCEYCGVSYTIGQAVVYETQGSPTTTISGTDSGLKAYVDAGKPAINGVNTTNGDQVVSRAENVTWVVLGRDDRDNDGEYESLLLTTQQPTSSQYYLYGSESYNNGQRILNTVCQELYGSNATGIPVDVINDCFDYVPTGAWYFNGAKYICLNNFTTKANQLPIWENGIVRKAIEVR